MKSVKEYNSDSRSLFRDFKRGKEEAFDIVFRSEYERLCRYANSIINEKDFAAAEDIVQEMFSRIWQKRFRINEEANLYNYLETTVKNMSLNYVKRQSRQVRLDRFHDLPVSEVPVEKSDIPIALANSIEELPKQCRKVFKIVVLEGKSYRDAAQICNITVNTVKTHMKHAYRNLRYSKQL